MNRFDMMGKDALSKVEEIMNATKLNEFLHRYRFFTPDYLEDFEDDFEDDFDDDFFEDEAEEEKEKDKE